MLTVQLCILLNILQLSLVYYGMPPLMRSVLSACLSWACATTI
jgi:hypothetical protein